MWPTVLLDRLPIVALVRLLSHQLANRPRAHPSAPEPLEKPTYVGISPSGISPPFGGLFLSEGQVTHVLLTRLPLSPDQIIPKESFVWFSLDSHSLGTLPAFVLSHDQTPQFKTTSPFPGQ